MGALKGKAAIVTGASRGMGRAIAQAMIEAGSKVALFSRSGSEISETAASLGSNAVGIECDVSDPASVKAAVAKAAAFLGGVDFLINNAGVCGLAKVDSISDDHLAREIGINLVGPILCCREAMPYLRASRGHIVNVTSELARRPSPWLSVYSATKAGLETFTSGLVQELRSEGIRVTALRSGAVRTTVSRDWNPEKAAAFFKDIVESGNAWFTGGGVSPEAMAEGLISILTMPLEINVDLVEMRSSTPYSSRKGETGRGN